MSKSNYKLNFDENGRVRYVIRAGKDWSFATATQEQAEWMMKNKPITRSTPTDWPDFQVCADGAYWFDGSWDDDAKEPSIFDDATDKTERPRTKNRRRGD